MKKIISLLFILSCVFLVSCKKEISKQKMDKELMQEGLKNTNIVEEIELNNMNNEGLSPYPYIALPPVPLTSEEIQEIFEELLEIHEEQVKNMVITKLPFSIADLSDRDLTN